jgi:hypothetical protein
MKDRLSAAAALAAAVCGAAVLFLSGCEGCGGKKIAVASLVSGDAPNAFFMSSPAATLERLRRMFVKFEGSAVGEQAKLEAKSVTEKFGFNPLDAAGWRGAGLDPSRGVAVFLEPVTTDGRRSDAVLIALGVSDQGKFDGTVKRLAKEKERAELYRDQRYKQAKVTTILRQAPGGEKPLFAYAFYQGYAIFGDPGAGLAAIRQVVDRKGEGGLDVSPSYVRTLSRIRPGSDAHLFISEGRGLEAYRGFDKRAEALFKLLQQHIKGMAAAVSLDGGLSAEIFLGLSPQVSVGLTSMMNGVPKASAVMLRNIGDDALAVLKVSTEFRKLYARMKDEAPAETAQLTATAFGWMRGYIEADLDERLMPLLTGDYVYALYPGNFERLGDLLSKGLFGGADWSLFSSVWAAGTSDAVKAMAFMMSLEEGLSKKGVQVTERQVNAVRFKTAQFRPGNEISWSVRDKMILGASGPGRLERAVLLSGGGPGGIMDKVVSDRVRDLLLSNDSQVLYLNFGGLGRALKAVNRDQLGKDGGTFIMLTLLELARDLLSRLDDGAIGLRAMQDGLKVEAYVGVKN